MERIMELIDRYLKAVGKGLPEAQCEDIIRELSEDIRSEMEDKLSELGRLPTEAEQQALLKQRGNPLLLAARYRQDHRTLAFGRQLIGPILFPFYIKVLSFNLGLTFIATIFVVLGVSGQKISFNDILSTCLLQLFIQAGVVTLIFALAEGHLTGIPTAGISRVYAAASACDSKGNGKQTYACALNSRSKCLASSLFRSLSLRLSRSSG